MNVQRRTEDNQTSLRCKDIAIVFCLAFHNMIVGANMTGPAYYNYKPKATCKDFNGKTSCDLDSDICSCIDGNQTIICQNFEYHGERGEVSIVTEWNLICDNERYDTLSHSSFFVAIAIGSLIAGTLIDRYGRKPVLFSCVFIQATIGTIISIYAHTYEVYVILQFVKGLFIQGIFISVYPLITEMMPARYAPVIAAIAEISWGLGVIALSITCYLIQNWRDANLVVCLAPLVITVISVWLIPESKIWKERRRKLRKETDKNSSMMTGQVERNVDNNDRLQVSYEMNKMNKDEIVEAATLLVDHRETCGEVSESSTTKKNQDKQTSSGSICSLLKTLFFTTRLRNHLFLMIFLWFSDAISYFGITFFIPKLSGNHYLNISGGMLLEIIIFIMLCLVVSKFGGRRTMCTTYIVGGVCYIWAAFLPNGHLQTAFAIAGKATIIGNYMCLLLLTIQIFPVELQGISIGIANFSGQVGAMFAPFMKSAAEHIWFGAPFILCSALYTTCAIGVYIFIRENNVQNLESKK